MQIKHLQNMSYEVLCKPNAVALSWLSIKKEFIAKFLHKELYDPNLVKIIALSHGKFDGIHVIKLTSKMFHKIQACKAPGTSPPGLFS